jgi:hypothetical protein
MWFTDRAETREPFFHSVWDSVYKASLRSLAAAAALCKSGSLCPDVSHLGLLEDV